MCHRVSERAADTLAKVHESRLYKIFLPLVSPITDPAVKRIMASTTFQVRPSALSHPAARWQAMLAPHVAAIPIASQICSRQTEQLYFWVSLTP